MRGEERMKRFQKGKRSKRHIALLVSCLIACLSGCSAVPQTDKGDEPVAETDVVAIYLYINENRLEVTLAENAAVSALVGILQENDITYTARDYGGFEKVGDLGQMLPANDSRITAEPGDVILYQGNRIVLFYGNNTWSYTRIGKISGYSAEELRTLLGGGKGDLPVRLSLL